MTSEKKPESEKFGTSDFKKPRYRPNYVDLDVRAGCLSASAALIFYAALSIQNDDFFIWLPGRRQTGYVHLHGVPVWLACISIFFACLSMLAVVVDHYDKRDNEESYRKFAKLALKAAFYVLVFAMLSDAIYFKSGSFETHALWPFGSS